MARSSAARSAAKAVEGLRADEQPPQPPDARSSSSKQVAGQVLVVTRLGPGGVCHVGYVDGRANPNANELAAKLADDHARTFKCGKDKPITAGQTGKGFSGLYGGG